MEEKDDLEGKVDALLKKLGTVELQIEYTEVLLALRQQYQEMKSEIQRLRDENRTKVEENKKRDSFLGSQSDSYIRNFLQQMVQRRLLENQHLLDSDEFDRMARGRDNYEMRGFMSYENFLNDSTEAADIQVTEHERKILYKFIKVINQQVFYPNTQTPSLRKDITEEIQYYAGLLKPVGVSTSSQETQTPLTSAGNQPNFQKYFWYVGFASLLAAAAIGGCILYRSLQDNSDLQDNSPLDVGGRR